MALKLYLIVPSVSVERRLADRGGTARSALGPFVRRVSGVHSLLPLGGLASTRHPNPPLRRCLTKSAAGGL
jgi:hypothetical protein